MKKKYTIAKRRFLGEWYWSQSLSLANWAIICFSFPRDTESPSGTPAILERERERENQKDTEESEEKQEGKSEMKLLLKNHNHNHNKLFNNNNSIILSKIDLTKIKRKSFHPSIKKGNH